MTPTGCEWIVEAQGCTEAALRDPVLLKTLFEDLIRGMALHPVEPTVWHQFPDPGGITGLCLLAESHLACHTFPEYGSLCLNVFCCRSRDDFDFESCLKQSFGDSVAVRVRKLQRAYGQPWN